ncbi:hypothetical protein O181_024287 [Austropuccinia psidii MF-1]|uniref:Reverse transcriptase Ty1/copia-type domain-containing protein n=1 Tax=Austropuccinia psidii MF-1 TaxID=1389203 RepID=A0A9Q3GYU2_9BASI|nr:hypothetical protein [Austropuccinia psidii MF-1]
MLNASKLPPFLWPWAYQHSVWIFNQSLHTNDGKTPFELLGGQKPSLDLLQVFGATSFVYTHNFKKDFSAREITGYHLGIADDSNGWLIWITGKKNITWTASVKFDEKTFHGPGKSNTWQVQSIQVANIFDRKMIDEIENQDRLITAISSEANPAMVLLTTYQEALKSLNRKGWVEAIDKELARMIKEDIFENVDLKEALAEFAPTPTLNALRLLFSTACLHKLPIKTFDVKVAFLHSLIDKPVFIWNPQGMTNEIFKVLKLKKALYGTKQASCCWRLHLKDILQHIGFRPNDEDPSTYIFQQETERSILWVHVDNGEITSSSNGLMMEIIEKLNKKIKIKWDDEIGNLVGITIKKRKEGFKFYQPDLINKLTHLMPSNITAKSPLPIYCKLQSNHAKEMDKLYLKRIGMLLYIAQASRPDICHAVSYLA